MPLAAGAPPVAPELVLLLVGGALLALGLGPLRARSEPLPWVSVLALGVAFLLRARLGEGAPSGPSLDPGGGLAARFDGGAALLERTVLAVTLCALVLASYQTRGSTRPTAWGGAVLLVAAGLGLLTGASGAATAALGLVLALGGGLAVRRLGRSGDRPASALSPLLLGVGALALATAWGVPAALTGSAALDGWVLAGSASAPAPTTLSAPVVALAVGLPACALALATPGRLAPSSAALLLVAAPVGLSALGLRVLEGLRFLALGAREADPRWALGAVGAVGAVAAHLVAARLLRKGADGAPRASLWACLALGQAALLPLALASAGFQELGAPVALRGLGTSALMLQAVAGSLAVLGLLALDAVADEELGAPDVAALAGLGRRNPWLGLWASVALASLVGLPGTAGFVARAHLLLAALATGHPELAVALCLLSVLIAAQALTLARLVWAEPAPEPAGWEPLVTSPGLTVTCAGFALLSLVVGLWPGALVAAARMAGGAS